jgi:hypothetical protein
VVSEEKVKADVERSVGLRAEKIMRKPIIRGLDDTDGTAYQPKFLGDETLSSKSPTHSQLLSIKKSAEQGASKIPISQKISSFISKMNVAPMNNKELSTAGAESGVSLKSLRVESIQNIQMPPPNQLRGSKPQANNSMERHRYNNVSSDTLKETAQGQNRADRSHDNSKVPAEM